MVISEDFFASPKDNSIVKTRIVAKYFDVWSRIIMSTGSKKVAYIDLFAGPGKYEDGTDSTPLVILKMAIQNDNLCKRLVSIFGDKNKDHSKLLARRINEIAGIDKLKYRPFVYTEEVSDDLVKSYEEMKFVPTFLFIDPYGYKGLSIRLIKSVLKDWGCDCVFFFNYDRINRDLSNPKVEKPIHALFGKERVEILQKQLKSSLNPLERENLILTEMTNTLRENVGNFILPFRFMKPTKRRTSHYLLFVSKDFKGYDIMKDRMAKESSSFDQGVPSFTFNPIEKQLTMKGFFEEQMLDRLENLLLESFAGQTLKMRQIYIKHSVGTRYIESNYKEALRKLEKKDRIKANPPVNKRLTRQGVVTFGNDVKVTFAKKDD